MTQDSYLWTTGGAGDGSATFTRADWSNMAKIFAACMDEEGVAPALLNACVGSVPGANTARIGTGGAIVDGKPYVNDAAVDVNIPSAVGGGNTRIDRIVLRADWSAQTVRITRIAGVDAASPSAPSITQTPGTTYDIMLYRALVNTSGVVVLTDERVFARPGTDTIVTAAIQDSAITPAKIANRTRTFFVPCVGGSNNTDALALIPGFGSAQGLPLENSKLSAGDGFFSVPDDFVSTMTVSAVVYTNGSGSGNVRLASTHNYGASNQAAGEHNGNAAASNIAINEDQREVVQQVSLSDAAIGDFVRLRTSRDATNAGDTVEGRVDLAGWLVSYTADS